MPDTAGLRIIITKYANTLYCILTNMCIDSYEALCYNAEEFNITRFGFKPSPTIEGLNEGKVRCKAGTTVITVSGIPLNEPRLNALSHELRFVGSRNTCRSAMA